MERRPQSIWIERFIKRLSDIAASMSMTFGDGSRGAVAAPTRSWRRPPLPGALSRRGHNMQFAKAQSLLYVDDMAALPVREIGQIGRARACR